MHIKAPQWIIRLLTRAITLVPVIVVAVLSNGSEHSLDDLIVYSQVFLSLALPFSIYPLIYFTSKSLLWGVMLMRDGTPFLAMWWQQYLLY